MLQQLLGRPSVLRQPTDHFLGEIDKERFILALETGDGRLKGEIVGDQLRMSKAAFLVKVRGRLGTAVEECLRGRTQERYHEAEMLLGSVVRGFGVDGVEEAEVFEEVPEHDAQVP